MSDVQEKCGYRDCKELAIYRGKMTVPKVEISRCQKHGGHHDYTHKFVDGRWIDWQPIYSRDKVSPLAERCS